MKDRRSVRTQFRGDYIRATTEIGVTVDADAGVFFRVAYIYIYIHTCMNPLDRRPRVCIYTYASLINEVAEIGRSAKESGRDAMRRAASLA